MAPSESDGWIDPEDRLIPPEAVSASLRDALRQRFTPDGRAFASAQSTDGARYRAAYRDGTVFIHRSIPTARISIPIPEPPGLTWEPETAYWLREKSGEVKAQDEEIRHG